MEPKVITLTMYSDYPYSLIKDYDNLKAIVQVQLSLDFSSEPHSLMIQKIRSLQNFTLKHLVKLLCFRQEQKKLNLFFEYIPRRLDSVLWNLKLSQIEVVEHNLLLLAQSLAYHYVLHEFKIQNVGLDQNNQLKYFLGFAFKIDKMMNKQETVSRYFNIIKGFFIEGGRLHRVQSPFKPSKNQYYETIDSQSSKTNEFNLSPQLILPKEKILIAIKKSTSTYDNMDKEMKNHFNHGIVKRLSLNHLNKYITKEPMLREFQLSVEVPKQESKEIDKNEIESRQPLENKLIKQSESKYNSSTTSQTKITKVEEIAARINKFKSIMKQATLRISTGNVARLMVGINGPNNHDQTIQENMLMLTASSSTVQKTAECKPIKLNRPYAAKQILSNQGTQVPSTEKKANNVISFNNQNSSKIIHDVMEANTPINKQFKNIFPSHMLRQKRQLEPKKTQRNSVDISKNRQQAPKILEDAQSRQYRKMARNDKYCEQFMQFLDDDKVPTKKEEKKHPTNNLFSQMIIEQQRSEQKITKEGDQTTNIRDRVKMAIRNSLKLINGLKDRDNQVPL